MAKFQGHLDAWRKTRPLTESEIMPGIFFLPVTGEQIQSVVELMGAGSADEDENAQSNLDVAFNVGLWMFTHVLCNKDGEKFDDYLSKGKVKKLDMELLTALTMETKSIFLAVPKSGKEPESGEDAGPVVDDSGAHSE